jgi:hypothetical protein
LKRNFQEYAWIFFVLALAALYDIDENSLLTFNGLFWVLYVAAIADIEILAAEERLQQVLLCSSPLPVEAEAAFSR